MKPLGNSRFVVCALEDEFVPGSTGVDELVPEGIVVSVAPLRSDATDPREPVAVETRAALPATFANVRLDIFLFIYVISFSSVQVRFWHSVPGWTNRLCVAAHCTRT